MRTAVRLDYLAAGGPPQKGTSVRIYDTCVERATHNSTLEDRSLQYGTYVFGTKGVHPPAPTFEHVIGPPSSVVTEYISCVQSNNSASSRSPSGGDESNESFHEPQTKPTRGEKRLTSLDYEGSSRRGPGLGGYASENDIHRTCRLALGLSSLVFRCCFRLFLPTSNIVIPPLLAVAMVCHHNWASKMMILMRL